MANPLLGQVLGSVFANAMRGRARTGPFGAGAASTGGAALDGMLGGMLGRGAGAAGGRRGLGGNHTLLLAMLLPYAMKWVQRNGGVGGVLERFRQKGLAQQADSWVSTGSNQALRAEEADEVVGGEELSRLAQQLGVPEREVALGFAEIVPELVDQLSPAGEVPPEADDALDAGRAEIEKELSALTQGAPV
ncbi:MAG: YidB family protein [Ramlibacter sp.]|nr:YidB family protein [Ramlibacter sp.]